MTNVVLAPARFPPHIQMRNGPVTSSRVFGLVFGLVCLSSRSPLSSLSLVCSLVRCGLWSGLRSGAALSSPVGCRFSPHMKNNHTKNNMLVHAYWLA